MKVLIVDDDFVSRSLIQTVLSHSGFVDVDLVVSGYEAIQSYMIAYQKGQPYGLIFLDLVMPKSSGVEALHAIRKFESEKRMNRDEAARIIVVSGLNDSKSIMGSFKAQCDHYVVKPINQENILEAMEKVGVINY